MPQSRLVNPGARTDNTRSVRRTLTVAWKDTSGVPFKKCTLLGITFLGILAFPALASANPTIQNASPNPATVGQPVTITAAPDDPGNPTTKTWWCDYNNNPNIVAGRGSSIVCRYSQPSGPATGGDYHVLLQEVDASGAATYDSEFITVIQAGDQPAYLTYAGPNPLGAHQVFGFRSPKRNVDIINWQSTQSDSRGEYQVGGASAVSCPSGSPRDERCFTLVGAPVNADVAIGAAAWNHDYANADKTWTTVHVVPDPPAAFSNLAVRSYGHRHGSLCTYGTILAASSRQGAYVVVKSHLEGRLPHHSWRVLAHSSHAGVSYVKPGSIRVDRSLRLRNNRGVVGSYLRNHHATFRYVVDQVVLYAGRVVYSQQNQRSYISRHNLARCSFDHTPHTARVSRIYNY